ncbi:MAG: DUF3373 family protein [Thermodesulfobacteriota bacterium]
MANRRKQGSRRIFLPAVLAWSLSWWLPAPVARAGAPLPSPPAAGLTFSGTAGALLSGGSEEPEGITALWLEPQLDLRLTSSLTLTGRVATARAVWAGPDDGFTAVTRLYATWQGESLPLRLAAGRLPTAGFGAPGHLRSGRTEPDCELDGLNGLTLDGISLTLPLPRPLPGKLSLYTARQQDWGYEGNDNPAGFDDTRFHALRWQATADGRRLSLQALLLENLYNVPEDIVFPNPIEFCLYALDSSFYAPTVTSRNLILDRKNLGDISQVSLVWLDRWRRLDLFVNLAWSHTAPDGVDELGTGLLSSFFVVPQSEDGYLVYAGLRCDLPELASKVGVEYNHGSRYWIAVAADKLAARGSVAEVYWTLSPPLSGPLAGPLDQVIFRCGLQHYWYDYTGSGYWLGEPLDIDEVRSDPLTARFYSPVDTESRAYAGVELFF